MPPRGRVVDTRAANGAKCKGPFWTSFLIRVYAWIGILKPSGLLNQLLLGLGLIDQPLALLHSNFAVYLGIVYSYLPFMILPLYANLVRLDPSLLEAAADLGCRPARAFFRVTLPLSLPGVIAGSLLVFIPAVGEFVIPDLLGGPDTLMIGKVLWTEFFNNRDWPVAAAIAVALLVVVTACTDSVEPASTTTVPPITTLSTTTTTTVPPTTTTTLPPTTTTTTVPPTTTTTVPDAPETTAPAEPGV